jgi:glycosyltransferase involved in cell wall biosynthesis
MILKSSKQKKTVKLYNLQNQIKYETMKNKLISTQYDRQLNLDSISEYNNTVYPEDIMTKKKTYNRINHAPELAEILFLTSYPPRECGIATYSQDLIKALNNKFSNSFNIKVCALESGKSDFVYPEEVKYTLDTSHISTYMTMAEKINNDDSINIVLIQHEFGFHKQHEQAFLQMLYELSKPVVIVFHTVLPHPDEHLRNQVRNIAAACKSIIVMTKTSADILVKEYDIATQKLSVIPHGTHLVPHLSEKFLKNKYGLSCKKVLTTFGLLSSGKSIETTLDALPAIVKQIPNVMFLIIGKTHPEVVKNETERYRDSLTAKVKELGLENNVKFINKYLDLPELLEYLQLTDIYVFTTNDPNQAVSGTFVYAMSCGCPIISTPIPHAKEVLTEDTGIIFDFRNSEQLAAGAIRLLNDNDLRKNIISNTLQKIVSTSWENSAVAHAMLIQKMAPDRIKIKYNLPAVNLNHFKAMTTDMGIIQFSKMNQPNINSGYTLDDNARALVATCMNLKTSNDKESIDDIQKYLDFIRFCQLPEGDFFNYVDKDKQFTDQNAEVNLDDSNGRAIWALGYLVSQRSNLPKELVLEAESTLQRALNQISGVKSTRAMAFIIKGIFYYQKIFQSPENIDLVKTFANRLVQMYKHESSSKWEWFEGYLTYANSIMPEAMLYAWLLTDDSTYKDIARSSFNFLLSQTYNEKGIDVISNRKWFQKGQERGHFGEQPIDVAYTIMSLGIFYDVFRDDDYLQKLQIAFNWFLGANRLQQIVYNPCTGGCYDGLEETHVNLNQGAESTVSYLMARLTVQKYEDEQ